MSAAALAQSAASQPPQTAAPSDSQSLAPVEVTGSRVGRLSYERLLRAIAAYQASAAVHAPTAELRLIVFDLAAPNRALLSVRYEGEDRMIPIAVEPDGHIAIPEQSAVGTTDGEIIINRRTAGTGAGNDAIVEPWVRSPGTQYDRRRLGDLRSECEFFSSWRQDDMNFLSRSLAKAQGGLCHGVRSEVGLPVGRRLVSAEISEGTRKQSLKLGEGEMHFYPPVADLSWSDEARVDLTFEAVPVLGGDVSRSGFEVGRR